MKTVSLLLVTLALLAADYVRAADNPKTAGECWVVYSRSTEKLDRVRDAGKWREADTVYDACMVAAPPPPPKVCKQGGARIGMTMEEVLCDGWGTPDSRSQTITARGTSEMWSYGRSGYLYFDNGVLTTIHK